MERRPLHILLILTFLLAEGAVAHGQRAHAVQDTTHLYKKIESFSKRSKITRLAYGLVFKTYTVQPRKRKPIKKTYQGFEGKVIRNIHIETLDPFGNTLTDTLAGEPNFLLKTGNFLHVKTQRLTVRNLLLIRPNMRFDSLLVKESERLVRGRPFVQDVSFTAREVAAGTDSVDLFIRVLDNWSIIPQFAASPVNSTFHLTDQNFMGTGHEMLNGFTRNIPAGLNTWRTNYSIPNIWNTYVSATVHYEKDADNNFVKSVVVDRPFYSAFTKLAGGVLLSDVRNVETPLHYRSVTQDYWVGQAQQLNLGMGVDKRLTNFITTLRYLRIRYLERPNGLEAPVQQFANETFFLTGIGLSNRKYVQDRFLFKYGVTEDVPVGKVYSLMGGYQTKNFVNRIFWGARFSTGNYYPWGYLSSNIEYETFYRGFTAEEGFLRADVKYFTELFEVGKWKFRQFVKPEITIGINRFAYDSLTLNSGFGIDGFKSNKISGTSRILLSLQTQAYAPWELIGFKFGPFFKYTLGMLGDAQTGFRDSRIYSQIGFGVLVKNENLILNTFQFSFSFYPVMPGNGRNVLNMNSFRTTDFGFSNFEVGKPGAKVFQ